MISQTAQARISIPEHASSSDEKDPAQPSRLSDLAQAAARGAADAPARLVVALLSVYRIALSPLLMVMFGPACRFEPSCSRYAADAIRAHGLIRGVAMALRRLARCHPLGGHGYDPVAGK